MGVSSSPRTTRHTGGLTFDEQVESRTTTLEPNKIKTFFCEALHSVASGSGSTLRAHLGEEEDREGAQQDETDGRHRGGI